jgi:flagellar M-ring protein FliF
MAKILAGLVVLLVLVLSVLRPMVKTLIGPVRLPAGGVLPRGTQGAAEAVGAAALPPAQRSQSANHDQQLAQARTLVNQDPKRVAQVVRGWVAKDE